MSKGGLALLALLAGACATKQAEPTHVCTREAKLCPDGSAVGRTGPACEFAPCPEDPCAGVELPLCPPACEPGAMERCGQPCADAAACGNDVGDGMTCEAGTWQCSVHAPLGMGCNRVCAPA